MAERINKRFLGSQEESVAAEYLEKQGYDILERNFRCRQGEIDIIARDGKVLCFIEVKYRTSRRAGSPGEAINQRKQATIYKVAQYYMYSKCIPEDIPCRFDAVVIEGEDVVLVKDAFGSLSS